jgi:hypothetical protein
VHKLIILHARTTDAGDITCRCVGQNETTAKLTVNKGGPDVDAGDQETGDGKVRARGKGKIQNFINKKILGVSPLLISEKDHLFLKKVLGFSKMQ